MKKITIEYRRWWRTVKRELNLPERWDELTPRQFLAAVNLWQGSITLPDFLREVFCFRSRELKRMDDYQRWVLLHATDWMRDLKRPHNAFFLERLPGTMLYSPGPRLKGCTLQQYMTVDTFFSQYTIALSKIDLRKGEVLADAPSERFLNMFLAALYKRENEVYSVTEATYNNPKQHNVRLVVLEDHIRNVEKIDAETKQAVVMNYILIRSWLCKAFPHLFPESGESAAESGTNKPREPRPTDWLSVFDNFVGDHISDIEKYKAMQATDAFRIMNRRIRDAKKRAAAPKR